MGKEDLNKAFDMIRGTAHELWGEPQPEGDLTELLANFRTMLGIGQYIEISWNPELDIALVRLVDNFAQEQMIGEGRTITQAASSLLLQIVTKGSKIN